MLERVPLLLLPAAEVAAQSSLGIVPFSISRGGDHLLLRLADLKVRLIAVAATAEGAIVVVVVVAEGEREEDDEGIPKTHPAQSSYHE